MHRKQSSFCHHTPCKRVDSVSSGEGGEGEEREEVKESFMKLEHPGAQTRECPEGVGGGVGKKGGSEK